MTRNFCLYLTLGLLLSSAVAQRSSENRPDALSYFNRCVHAFTGSWSSLYEPGGARGRSDGIKLPRKYNVTEISAARELSTYDKHLDISRLNFTGDFNTQVEALLSAIRLTREEVEDLDSLYQDIEETLTIKWPGSRVRPVGSIVSGLGLKTSDADCFIHLPPWSQQPGSASVAAAKTLLARYPDKFADLVAIPTARVPILKFFHIPTQRNGDISFTHEVKVKYAELVKFLLQIDGRVMKLAILIKFWTKLHYRRVTEFLPKHCLLLITIFYFQQLGILPSVHWLQSHTEAHVLDDWDTNFLSDISRVPTPANKMKLQDIVGGFFKFYSTYDFSKYVISPFLGISTERSVFKNLSNVPDNYNRYGYNIRNGLCLPLDVGTPICIQDPFQHDENSAVSVDEMLAHKITSKFREAATLYEESGKKNYSDFLRKLLFRYDKVR